MRAKLNWLFRVARSYFPRRLPVGLTEFNLWIAEIIYLSGLPDNASTRRAASGFILGLSPQLGYVPLRHIVNQLIKAAANQVAAQVFSDATKEAQTDPTGYNPL